MIGRLSRCGCALKIVECNTKARACNDSLCSLLLRDRDRDCYCRGLTIHRLPLSLPQLWREWHTTLGLTSSHSKMVGSEASGLEPISLWRFLCRWQDKSNYAWALAGEIRSNIGRNQPAFKGWDTGLCNLGTFWDLGVPPSDLLCDSGQVAIY